MITCKPCATCINRTACNNTHVERHSICTLRTSLGMSCRGCAMQGPCPIMCEQEKKKEEKKGRKKNGKKAEEQ